MLKTVISLLVLLALVPSAAAAQQNYLIGPQDVLSITVWDQEDLVGKFAVEADGTFTFPMIGRVKAGGGTVRDVEEEMKRRLKDGFFVNPQVTVAIEQYRSQRVFVMGEVRNPCTCSMTGDMTLIEVLSRAGSTLPSAGDEAVIVRPPAGAAITGPLMPDGTRGAPGDAEVIRVDIRDLQRGVLGQNVRLRDGDTVFVPKAPTVFIFGQVRNPNEYPVRRETTVLNALSLAGGVTDRGSTDRVWIVRVVKDQKTETKAKLTDIVQPGDTIIVRERLF